MIERANPFDVGDPSLEDSTSNLQSSIIDKIKRNLYIGEYSKPTSTNPARKKLGSNHSSMQTEDLRLNHYQNISSHARMNGED